MLLQNLVNFAVEMLMKAISGLCHVSKQWTFSTCFALVWFSSQRNLLYDIGLNASTFSIHKSLIDSSINDFIIPWYGCFLKTFTEIYSREQWWKIVYHPLLFTWDTLKKQGQIYLPMYADWGDHQKHIREAFMMTKRWHQISCRIGSGNHRSHVRVSVVGYILIACCSSLTHALGTRSMSVWEDNKLDII